MLNKVKIALRIKSNSIDLEIQELIEAALLDLKISGIKNLNESDPLIVQAVKTYCKANFGLDNKDSDKYQKSYNMLKEHLALCGEYINVE